MATGFDLGGLDTENLDAGGDRAKPGKYLVLVQEVIERDGYYDVVYEIQRGNVPDQEGKTHKERLYLQNKAGEVTDGTKRRILMFHIACGLETHETLKGKQARNEQFVPDIDGAIGRKLVLELAEEPSKDDPNKKFTNITFNGFLHPRDPKSEGIVGCGPQGTETCEGAAGAGGGDFSGVF
jgi:hypothetical protein